MLDCIMKKGREVFLNINEFQHLGLPEVWSLPPVSTLRVGGLPMSEADEWRLGPPVLPLRILRSPGCREGSHLSERPPGCESLHTIALRCAAWSSLQQPILPSPWLSCRLKEWPLDAFQRDIPLQDIWEHLQKELKTLSDQEWHEKSGNFILGTSPSH